MCLFSMSSMTGCSRTMAARTHGGGPRSSWVISDNRVVTTSVARPTIRLPRTTPLTADVLWTPPASRAQDRELIAPFTEHEDYRLTRLLRTSVDTARQSPMPQRRQPGQEPSRPLLGRAEKYMPMILEALSQRGLPLELAFLPFVESIFEPKAISSAGAAGLWQLMPATAHRFGLKISAGEDERFDVRKSTRAATAYLAWLYGRFDDWPLALAAYNCGEGALSRAMEYTGARSLSELTAACRQGGRSASCLPQETLEYVPRFLAAVQTLSRSTGFPVRVDTKGGAWGVSDLEGSHVSLMNEIDAVWQSPSARSALE